MSGRPNSRPKERFGELHPIDVHVGSRLREGRLILRLTQTDLARYVGLTFQQIQKYELGTNRISASVLWAVAQRLGVNPNWFYEGLIGLTPEQISVENARPQKSKESILISLLADTLTAEEQTAVLAVIEWLRSRQSAH